MPCNYPGCVAFVHAADLYCTVHDPVKVMARVVAIVKNNFGPFVAGRIHRLDKDRLAQLRDDILHDLQETV